MQLCYTCYTSLTIESIIMVGVRLGEKTEERLAHLAQMTGRSKSYYLKQAVEKFLDEREEYLIAISELEKVHQGESTIGIKELMKRIEEMDD